ncbi:MAG: AAA family ATPase [Luteitalea sp.]|nr:AAA family ATPase [Luteitalea sp.]
MKAPETEEREHLAQVTDRLRQALQNIDARLKRYSREIQEEKTYLWESRADMDRVEKAFTRESIHQTVMTGEAALAHRTRLQKLLRSPYFGRFDFIQEGRAQPDAIYVGVHHFSDDRDTRTCVYDWRAPISTMFYDHETGPAHYESPSGSIRGEMVLKRQFRIRDGQLELMLETALTIVDDVLQEELSRASGDGMKQIVATIQRDQNAIIRNEDAQVLIIQGVAGSGKTSIALHRIAFLLYRFKDRLTSKDILIISPNRVFADYISTVLPELGEESIGEIGMETLARELLGQKHRFQTFIEQTALLLENSDAGMRRRIEVKSSPEFLETLNEYADHVERRYFQPEDLWLGGHRVPAAFIERTFRRHRSATAAARLGSVVSAIEHRIGLHHNHDLRSQERTELKKAVRKMYQQSSLRATYKNLFAWIGAPELFKMAKNATLEYADVFPLIYLKLRLEGIDALRRDVKHLLIDEMQDYTPVQYAVIARLFPCKKTILGDTNQSVNPYSSSKAEDIQRVFTQAACVNLCKSYRSTYEITQFAQRISPNPDLVAIERHGETPEVLRCKNASEELNHVSQLVGELASSRYGTAGIICKTQKQAARLYEAINNAGYDVHLLTAESTSFARGVIVCTAHMAKGLEFDQVIVPDVTDQNYNTSMDRNLLYVACTRAMHKLTLTFAGEPTRLIQP